CIEQSLNCNLSCWRSMPDAALFKTEAEFSLDNTTSEVCKTLWNQTSGDREGSCDFTCPCHERSPRSLAVYLYAVSVVLASLASGAAYTTSDAAICELLGDRAKSYGRQRLWGTLGYGVCSPLLGFFIDEANRLTEGRSGYTPCLILFAAFLLLDMLLLCCIPRLTMTKAPSTFLKDVGSVFGRLHVAVFALWACFLGALYTITSSYSTWLLEDIAAPKLIVGLYRAVGTLVELPMFFLSGPLLKQMGYFPVCSLAFALHAVGHVAFSLVRNPWYTLLTAIPSGAAFSLAISSITVFAKEAAPPGTTASVMCILSVLGIEGVGAALGNLLGGTGFEKYGGRAVFRYAGIAAFACTILCTLSRIIMRQKGF
ncbi:maltose permease, putative, partial [Ixodes scapularis]